MIFIFSILMWFSISPETNMVNIFLGISVSVFVQVIGYMMYPNFFTLKFVLKLVVSIPKVLYQAFKMILTKNYFTIVDKKAPEKEDEEFSEVVNINFTPEEVVVTKEHNHLIIHKVSKK